MVGLGSALLSKRAMTFVPNYKPIIKSDSIMGSVIMVNSFTRLIIQVPLVVQKTGVLFIRIANAEFAPIYSGK